MTAVQAVEAAIDVVRTRSGTIGEILAHEPPLMDLPTFFNACGIPESTGYQEAAKGALPVEVIRIARRRYVRTVDAWRFLGLLPGDNGDGVGAGTPTPPAETHPSTASHH